MVHQERQPLTDRIERTFEAIYRERMSGLPILNPHLAVSLVGMREWQGGWLGVLITPWMMNLIALPGPETPDGPGVPGSTRARRFPSGRYEFVAATDPQIGPHETCSLFSPMGDFTDQAAALATAEAILDLLFNPVETSLAGKERAQSHAAVGADAALRRTVSRRGLLRAALGGRT